MLDPTIAAALVTSSFALILGVINMFNAQKQRKKNEEFSLKEEQFKAELNKQLESFKYQNQIELDEKRQEDEDIHSKKEQDKSHFRVILENLQKIKDSIPIIENIGDANEIDFTELEVSINDLTDLYSQLYMELDENEQNKLHKLKNELHKSNRRIEQLKVNTHIKEENYKKALNNEIKRIEDNIADCQKLYKESYEKIK